MSLLQNILNIIYPSDIKCIFCDEDLPETNLRGTCPNCIINITFNNAKHCQKCGKPLRGNVCPNCLYTKYYFKQARAPLVYEGLVKTAIHNLKFNGFKDSAKYLATFLFDEYQNFNVQFDSIVAVPLSSNRLKKRGYNQAYELLKHLNIFVHLEDLSTSVARIKDTLPQAKLNITERKKNIKSAFKVLDNKFRGKNILIIDDVVTTTATVNALSKILLEAGALSIYVLSLAHG